MITYAKVTVNCLYLALINVLETLKKMFDCLSGIIPTGKCSTFTQLSGTLMSIYLSVEMIHSICWFPSELRNLWKYTIFPFTNSRTALVFFCNCKVYTKIFVHVLCNKKGDPSDKWKYCINFRSTGTESYLMCFLHWHTCDFAHFSHTINNLSFKQRFCFV